MLDRGADVNAFDPMGRTPLMYAAGSDLLPVDVVKLLIDSGADVNARNRHQQAGDAGLSVLEIAMLRGKTPIVDMLLQAGAKGTAPPAPAPNKTGERTIRAAVERSTPLLQKADAGFIPKGGCVSCHNDSLAAMAVGLGRKNGFRVDEQISAQQVKANVALIEKARDRLHQGALFPVGDFFSYEMLAYVLVGLDAEHYKPDLNTDTVAMHIRARQMPNGEWRSNRSDSRPPLGSDYIGETALCMRALQLYAPKVDKAGCARAVEQAAVWLAGVKSITNDDMCWRLLGLGWSAMQPEAKARAMQELLAAQRPDGGWADIRSTESNAYATGRALVALRTAGLPATDAAYARGVRFLLNTQEENGSWHVRTRALAFQPYFESGFPHGFDQWISAAGTSWATMALALAAPPQPSTVTRLR